jgi:hypothetical protein
MREIDSSYDEQLAALSEINCSLREQVIELTLSIAEMRESAGLLSNVRSGSVRATSYDHVAAPRVSGSVRSATVVKMRGHK